PRHNQRASRPARGRRVSVSGGANARIAFGGGFPGADLDRRTRVSGAETLRDESSVPLPYPSTSGLTARLRMRVSCCYILLSPHPEPREARVEGLPFAGFALRAQRRGDRLARRLGLRGDRAAQRAELAAQ